MATILDIGKRYKKTEAEVRDALAVINFAKRITVATKIESSVEQQLDAYWREQDAAPKPQLNRTIGRTAISERPLATMLDIGKRYKKTEAEVRDALAAINFAKRITVATKIESLVEQQLDAYWREQDAAPKPQLNRTIGRTEFSERPRRVVKPPAPPPKQIAKPKPVVATPTPVLKEKPAQVTTPAAAKSQTSMPRALDVNDVLRNISEWAEEKGYSVKASTCKCRTRKGKPKRFFPTKDLVDLAILYWLKIEGIEQEAYKCPHKNGFHLRTVRKKR